MANGSNAYKNTIDKTTHHSRLNYSLPTRSLPPTALDNTDLADQRNFGELHKARQNKQLQKDTAANMTRQKSTSIPTAALNKLKEAKATLESTLADLEKECASLKDKLKNAEDSNTEKDGIIDELKGKLSGAMNLLMEKNSKGRRKKQDLNSELLGHVKDAVSKFIFRTYHFIEDNEDCEAATKDIIKYLPVALGMDEDVFIADYKGEVATAIGSQRNYTQGQARKAVLGKYHRVSNK
jgi:hypothetical protein